MLKRFKYSENEFSGLNNEMKKAYGIYKTPVYPTFCHAVMISEHVWASFYFFKTVVHFFMRNVAFPKDNFHDDRI